MSKTDEQGLHHASRELHDWKKRNGLSDEDAFSLLLGAAAAVFSKDPATTATQFEGYAGRVFREVRARTPAK